MLGSGGFGLVYRVRHLLLDEERAIKEYLPSEIAVREGETVYARSGAHQSDYQDGLDRFLKEARQLVRFDGHRNIIRCRDYFEANGTAYLVMDFEDGLPLDTFLAKRKAQGGPLTAAELCHLGSARTSGCVSDSAVVGGGSWSGNPRNLRCANRSWLSPSVRYVYNGFRLVQAPQVPEWPRPRSRPE